MTTEDFKEISHTIPKSPGVYRFIDKGDTIIYVGKAKSLRSRLGSYFGSKKHMAYKTRTMVKNADHIEYTIVDTEHDALLLENTFIKKFQPRYNVNLKDGKSYAYLCIKNERFPRVFFTRRVYRDGSTYFGPYTSKHRANIILELIKKLFQLRTCKYNLSKENVEAGKFTVCLEYHIKNCQGPCVGLESEQSYNAKIDQVKNILRGNFKQVKDYLQTQMDYYAQHLEFEKAQELKEKFDVFTSYQSKSTVVSATIRDVDVFTITTSEDQAYVNYLKVINGALINTDTVELDVNLDTDEDDLLTYAIFRLREKFDSISPEVVLSKELDLGSDITVTVPQRGDKRKLLELSEKNVKYYLLQKRKQAISHQNRQTPSQRILTTLRDDLQMEDLPMHIECFDNSNIQGTNPTSSCVVFKNAKPAKRDYRHYKIKTVEGPNDFASMEEVVYRRYRRLLEEGESLPQLIIIDGGKGQLSSAVKSLNKLGITDRVTIIGIAKQLEEIFFPGDSVPLYINKKSESLKLIQHARNESHRFAINFHRQLRSKNAFGTELTEIEGVGPKTSEKLLKHFGSVNKIKTQSLTQLEEVIGKRAAIKVRNYFDQEK
jgi:excinuclease ABC subunit C